MKILLYSKFIFDRPSATPSQAPRQTVGAHIDTQQVKSHKYVEQKKRAAETLKKKKEGLLKFWQNNNPEGKLDVVEDDPKAIVFHEIRDPLRAKEAYLLMSLIERFWEDMGGINLAMRLYEQAKAGRKKAYDIDFKPFEHFFRKGNHAGSASERLGFYFWESKNKWYTYDQDKGSDDEAGGSTYLTKCTSLVRTEFNDKENKDSGLSVEQEKYIMDFLKQNEKESAALYAERYRTKGKKLIKWFKSKAAGKWTVLDSKTARSMNVLFGAGVGKYLYRYEKDQHRIYFIRLQGATFSNSEGESGYIEVKNNKLGSWQWYDDINDLKKNLLDKMNPETVTQELFKEKTRAGEHVKEKQAIVATKKTLIRIHKVRKVKYSNIDSNYAGKLEKELKVELKKKGYEDSRAQEVAKMVVDSLKRKVEKKINDTPELKEAKKDDPDLEISLDNEGEPNVKFKDSKLRAKIKKRLEAAKKAASEAGLDKLIDQKTKALTKGLGPLAIFLKWFGVDLKKDVAEYYKTGKKSMALWLAASFSSVAIGRRILRGKGVDSPKDLEKLAKKNGGILKKDQPFNKEFKPTGYKITIPKGKGIKPGGTFTANGEVISPQKEKKEKPKFSFLAIFGSKKSTSKFVMKDKEIVITQNDKIPKGTIIPKGTKIEKL